MGGDIAATCPFRSGWRNTEKFDDAGAEREVDQASDDDAKANDGPPVFIADVA